MKESYILHTNAWPAIEKLADDQLGRLFRAINLYALGEEVPELDAATHMAFAFIAAQLDRDDQKYSEISARRRAAAEARWQHNNANASKSMQTMQMHDLHYDNENDNGNDNGNGNENDNDNINVVVNRRAGAPATTKTTERAVFKKPSIEQVAAYCQERNNGIDAEGFVDYYEANGWKVGRNPMKDWKATVRTWERKGTIRKTGTKSIAELAAEAVAQAEKEKQEHDDWWS